MKRLIKFRGKTESGNWVCGNLSILNKGISDFISAGAYISSSAGNPFAYAVDPDTVGQFTGLLDKNWKEIYEGDVIRVSAYINKGQGETYDFRDLFTVEDLKGFHRYDFISDIKFNEGGFYLSEYSECDTSLCVLFGDMRHSFPILECEVLGNIHDNPELLKGGEE